jgi:hypothetical protein
MRRSLVIGVCVLLAGMMACKPPAFDKHVKCDDGFEATGVATWGSGSGAYLNMIYIIYPGPDPRKWAGHTGKWHSSDGCLIEEMPTAAGRKP